MGTPVVFGTSTAAAPAEWDNGGSEILVSFNPARTLQDVRRC